MVFLWSILIVALVCGVIAWMAEMLPLPMQPFVRVAAVAGFMIWLLWALTHRISGFPPP